MDLVILNRGQMTRTAPELAPLSKLPHHINGRTFGQDGFNVHQSRLPSDSSVESGFEPATLWPRGQDLNIGHRASSQPLQIYAFL
ncbi:hypothetical protein AVEN_137653-1 [Araneus ventricosus]|uniref:Uncharacterized protein n=1 Tax=Araneus ventricosus TaxID=182803 RepID=A0A4Y2UIN1_ARAVE|nr:hypothetical protein AVEN_137653-1 [Araneus ventricosus]